MQEWGAHLSFDYSTLKGCFHKTAPCPFAQFRHMGITSLGSNFISQRSTEKRCLLTWQARPLSVLHARSFICISHAVTTWKSLHFKSYNFFGDHNDPILCAHGGPIRFYPNWTTLLIKTPPLSQNVKSPNEPETHFYLVYRLNLASWLFTAQVFGRSTGFKCAIVCSWAIITKVFRMDLYNHSTSVCFRSISNPGFGANLPYLIPFQHFFSS